MDEARHVVLSTATLLTTAGATRASWASAFQTQQDDAPRHLTLQSDGFPPLPTLAATHALSGEIPSPLLRFLAAVNKDWELLPSAFIDAETQVLGFVTYQVFFLNSLFSQQFQSP